MLRISAMSGLISFSMRRGVWRDKREEEREGVAIRWDLRMGRKGRGICIHYTMLL